MDKLVIIAGEIHFSDASKGDGSVSDIWATVNRLLLSPESSIVREELRLDQGVLPKEDGVTVELLWWVPARSGSAYRKDVADFLWAARGLGLTGAGSVSITLDEEDWETEFFVNSEGVTVHAE